MSSSQPYSYKKWFGILANPDDTVEYLRKGSMPRNTDTGIVEDLDKAFAREAEMRDEAAKNYNDMVRKGQAEINKYKQQGNKEAEIWARLHLNSRKNEVQNLAPQSMVEIQNEAGLGKDNPEARKNILEWQKRVHEEELQKAKEATKPVKGLDSRYTQPPPPSALDKVNKIMKG